MTRFKEVKEWGTKGLERVLELSMEIECFGLKCVLALRREVESKTTLCLFWIPVQRHSCSFPDGRESSFEVAIVSTKPMMA